MRLSTMLRHRSGSSCFDKPRKLAMIFLVTNLSVKLPSREYCLLVFNKNFFEDPCFLDMRKQERITSKVIIMTRKRYHSFKNLCIFTLYFPLFDNIVKLSLIFIILMNYNIFRLHLDLFNRRLIKI